MKLPPDTGYSVDSDGMVHRRHPHGHAEGGRKTRTSAGVDHLLAGKRGKVCRSCYPLPERGLPWIEAPDKGQRRRLDDEQHVTPDAPPTA